MVPAGIRDGPVPIATRCVSRSGRLLLVFMFPVVRRARSGEERTTPSSGGRAHWHRFRWAGDDAFSGSSIYACRCGEVRPAP
jgi:hypothetical protein